VAILTKADRLGKLFGWIMNISDHIVTNSCSIISMQLRHSCIIRIGIRFAVYELK